MDKQMLSCYKKREKKNMLKIKNFYEQVFMYFEACQTDRQTNQESHILDAHLYRESSQKYHQFIFNSS